ncbi:MAG: diphosphomevalonate decarboxylase [Nanoarchaeota archaeon]
MKATALAHPNIALIKYWGKRDKLLFLPQNGSISLTLDGMWTKTTIEFSNAHKIDSLTINNEPSELTDHQVNHLDKIRELGGTTAHAKIASETNFPVGAGLASSASGLAALTAAATKALGLELTEKELSILTRQGSGSASRSICEGFAEWHRGEKDDGTDSFAETIAPKDYWPGMRLIATIVSEEKKKISSRAGHEQTVATCPYYGGWLATIKDDLTAMRTAIKEKDFTLLGETAEFNCLKMHATMITTKPSIMYWEPASVEIMHAIQQWREEGLESYFTIDAGPQVKVLCMEKDVEEIEKKLQALLGVKRTIVCKPGDGVSYSEEHLF